MDLNLRPLCLSIGTLPLRSTSLILQINTVSRDLKCSSVQYRKILSNEVFIFMSSQSSYRCMGSLIPEILSCHVLGNESVTESYKLLLLNRFIDYRASFACSPIHGSSCSVLMLLVSSGFIFSLVTGVGGSTDDWLVLEQIKVIL